MDLARLCLNPATVTRLLALVAVLLVLASVAGQLMAHVAGHRRVLGLVHLFNVDAERNIPTAFSSLLLWFAAFVAAGIAVLERQRASRWVKHWAVLALGFVVMGFDEAWSFHEQLIIPLRNLLGGDDLGLLFFSWVLVGAALVAVLAVFYFRFILSFSPRVRAGLIVAAALYLGGALIMESVGGWYYEGSGGDNLGYSLITTVEEGLEMAGIIVFIWALLTYLAEAYQTVQVQVGAVRQVGVEAAPVPATVRPLQRPDAGGAAAASRRAPRRLS